MQHFTDEPLKVCPECQGAVQRVICPVGIVFKGSGFYVTDHRSKSPTSLAGNRKEDTPPAASDSGHTEEAKTPAPASSEAKTKMPQP